jgi:RNA polymerase sigma factor (sigma-70 family)
MLPNQEDDPEFVDIYRRLLSAAKAAGHRDGGAEDRVQDACVRLLEIGRTQEIRAKENYFRRILRNLRLDGLRQQARQSGVPIDALLLVDLQPGPDRIAQDREELQAVAKALEALPPRCRTAFELHRFGNLSYAEIANRMGISSSMVEKHIAQAILRLAAAIEP